ncbi:hypothetical protein [Solidesulfovibrio magneticus]|uniref:Uncharacterized protein n=1 Tax=Solidesulfovibrio magneticus (strain ATCC 700980 / DSM 13731 / RS-1) TaxID=573370 RepID=C4XGB7_SOLM1|nr:hypothetical protein [Solidesulfovibrio magneticus]BAH73697.1 hypothetical protein DMR_02060 [Solidesulfovibrio magneticus RS-1]
MSTQRVFSVWTITITAVVTFVISGIGGSLFNEYLKRPKPEVVVTSIGFTGGQQYIDIGEELVILTRDNPWSESFERYQTYSSLEKSYENMLRMKKMLEAGIENVKSWTSHNLGGSRQQLSLDEILKTPLCNLEIIGSLLIGSIIREEVSSPPISLERLRATELVTNIDNDGDRWMIYLKRQVTNFPYKRCKTKHALNMVECLARSFACGSVANIAHFMNEYQTIAYRDLDGLNRTISGVEKVLLPKSHISLSALVYNSGSTALTVNPYMGLKFEHEDLNGTETILAVSKRLNNGHATGERDEGNDSEGTSVYVEPFLPKKAEGDYLFVPPNSEVRFELESVEAIGGEHGKRIKDLFSANALRCKLIAQTDNGGLLVSSSVIFGRSVSKAQKDSLANVLR